MGRKSRINMNTVKITDVAKAAGVSTATVSRVLSTPEVARPQTRDKVMQAVRELGYQPNMLARQLRTQTTSTVIVITPDIENSFLQGVIEGIGAEADQYGYHMLIADLNSQPSLGEYYYEALLRRQVDGVISLSASMTNLLMNQVQPTEKRIPIVAAVQPASDLPVPCVSIDNVDAARAAVRHLIRLGHRKIAFLSAPSEYAPYKDRLAGYRSALEEHDIMLDDKLIRYGQSSLRGGYEQMQDLLSRGAEFDALFAAGDVIAIGAMKAMEEAGIKVPGDCAIVGFDDIDISSFSTPKLTTIRQPRNLIGRRAFQKLLGSMKGEIEENTTEILPYELVIRESCGYLA